MQTKRKGQAISRQRLVLVGRRMNKGPIEIKIDPSFIKKAKAK